MRVRGGEDGGDGTRSGEWVFLWCGGAGAGGGGGVSINRDGGKRADAEAIQAVAFTTTVTEGVMTTTEVACARSA